MRKKLNKKRLADQLDAYIDHPSHAERSGEKLPEASIVDVLRLSAASVEPTPAFVKHLSATLHQHQITRSPSPHPRVPLSPSPRLLWAGAAVAAALVLALVLPALIGGDHDLPPLPRLVQASSPGSQPIPQGLLASADLTLTADLPDAPAEVTVYRVTTAPLPTTPEEALAWARNFGLPDPRVYRDPREPEALFVLSDDGQQLTFRQFGPMGSIDYGNAAAAPPTVGGGQGGAPLPLDQAADVAVTFLREHDLLPVAHRIQDSEHFAPRPENPIRFVHVVPELNGHPLVGYRSGAQVAVNPAGQVTYASFNPLTFERDGDYPIKPVQEAYEDLSSGQVTGSPFRLDTDIRYSAEMDVQHYSPPPPVWSIGQPVTITGWVQVLVAEDGDDVRAQLMARDGTQYDLAGPRVAELSDVGFDDVQIQGMVVAQVGPDRWQVEVTDWETVPPRKPQDLTGTFTRERGSGWLTTDEGERYRLLNAPEELSDGERIEVWADERPAEGEGLDWWSITAPPMSENEVAAGAVSQVIVSVESEKILPETPVGVEAPVGIPTPKAPFEIGQSVEVTGAVHATIFVSGKSRRVEAFLDVDEPGEERPFYPLSGPPDVLEAIAQLDQLHVRVRGRTIASAQEWAPGGLGIEIEDFEKIWPDEHVQGFLGHIDLETLEGREVAVFTDRETGQRYVLGPDVDVWAADYARPGAPPPGEQTWVAGVIHPTQTFAGLPVLAPHTMRSGPSVKAATSAGEIPLDIPQVVDESRFPPGPGELQGTFVVDRVELAYYYEPQMGYVARSTDRAPTWTHPTEQTVQPVWVFYGHNADDTVRFTAYVQAVAEEHVQNATP